MRGTSLVDEKVASSTLQLGITQKKQAGQLPIGPD